MIAIFVFRIFLIVEEIKLTPSIDSFGWTKFFDSDHE